MMKPEQLIQELKLSKQELTVYYITLGLVSTKSIQFFMFSIKISLQLVALKPLKDYSQTIIILLLDQLKLKLRTQVQN